MANITSKSGRSRLKAQREPYWSRISTGLYIGYRALKQGEGTWIARRRSEDGRQQYKSFGTISDDKAYDVAVKKATEWSYSMQHGISNKAMTVSDACKAYVEDRRLHKSDANAKDAEGRFKRLVYQKKIGRIALDKLTTAHVKAWLNKQIDQDEDDEDIRRAKDSANRNLSALKAALNLALKDRLVATDAGWKTVTPFKNVGRRRTEFLTLQQRKALLNACPDDLAALVKALLLTGARPGELAKATAGDFDKVHGTIALTGKTGHRICTLSSAAKKLFAEMAKGKTPKAPLIARSDGKHFDKDSWKKLFRESVIAGNLPANIVIYTLRHTAITEMVNNGMDSFIVAKLAGTSTAMIDKHYGQLRHDKTRERLDKVSLL